MARIMHNVRKTRTDASIGSNSRNRKSSVNRSGTNGGVRKPRTTRTYNRKYTNSKARKSNVAKKNTNQTRKGGNDGNKSNSSSSSSSSSKRKRTLTTIADKNRYVEDYYHKHTKNKSYVSHDKMITREDRVLGKSGKLALLRRNGIRVHTRNCNMLLHKESDDFLKKLAKKTVISMHLFLMSKRHKNETSFRIMPKHVENALELMNYSYLI